MTTAILPPQFDLIDPKQEKFKEVGILDLSIPPLAFLLIPLVPLCARLNSTISFFVPQDCDMIGCHHHDCVTLPRKGDFNAIKFTNQLS